MDHGWQVRSEAREHIAQPPSAYLRKFYYDCIVYTEPALRFLIDHLGSTASCSGRTGPTTMALDGRWRGSWA